MIGQGYSSIPRDNLNLERNLNGNSNDTSGNSRDGTASNMTWNTFDKIRFQKQYGTFNGSTSRIAFPNLDAMWGTELSFAIWLDTTNPATEQRNSLKSRFEIRAISSTFNVRIYDTAWVSVSTGTVLANTTYLLVATWKNGDKMKLYLNGQYVTEASAGNHTITSGAGSYYLGTIYSAASTHWSGNMYGLRIYGDVLTPSEIQALYLEGLGKLGQY